jgi:hypothetical protein
MDDSRKTPMVTGFPREDEARSYLEKHRILELLDNLTAQLVFHRPSEPKEFLIEQLTRLKEARKLKRDYPCLFDDSNLEAMFRMMDPEGRGYISSAQYNEALRSLGVSSPSIQRTADTDKVTMDVFVRAAKLGLVKASATVSP